MVAEPESPAASALREIAESLHQKIGGRRSRFPFSRASAHLRPCRPSLSSPTSVSPTPTSPSCAACCCRRRPASPSWTSPTPSRRETCGPRRTSWAEPGTIFRPAPSTSPSWIRASAPTRAALALRARGHFFVGPDNGLFTPVLRDAAVEVVATPDAARRRPRRSMGATCSLPPPRRSRSVRRSRPWARRFVGIPERLATAEPRYEGKSVVGEVIYVDRFGTLVTNLTPEHVPSYATLQVEDLDLGPLRRTFGDVVDGRAGGVRGLGRCGRDRRAEWIGCAPAGPWSRRAGPGAAGLGPGTRCRGGTRDSGERPPEQSPQLPDQQHGERHQHHHDGRR